MVVWLGLLYSFNLLICKSYTEGKSSSKPELPSVEGKITAQAGEPIRVHDEDGVHVSYIPKVVFGIHR